MKQVLVIGAEGYIGGRVAAALARSDWATPILDPSPAQRADGNERVQAFGAMDAQTMFSILRGVDAVVNCEAGSPQRIAGVARSLFETAARVLPTPLIVHVSSMSVYGSACGEVCEDQPLRADLGPYCSAMVFAESIAAKYANKVVLRPGVEYGPECELWSGRIGKWLFARRVGDLGAAGDGVCNLVHVEDLVNAVLLSLQRPEAVGGVFNLAMPDAPTWNEYFVRFALALGAVPVKRITHRWLALETSALAVLLKGLELPLRAAGLARIAPPPLPPSLLRLTAQEIRLVATRAQGTLGWASRPLDRGLAETAAWFRSVHGRTVLPTGCRGA